MFGSHEERNEWHWKPVLAFVNPPEVIYRLNVYIPSAIAWPVDHTLFTVFQQAVEDGGGHHVAVVEDAAPLLAFYVGGHNGRLLRVPFAEDLEKRFCALLVQRQIPQLVNGQNFRRSGVQFPKDNVSKSSRFLRNFTFFLLETRIVWNTRINDSFCDEKKLPHTCAHCCHFSGILTSQQSFPQLS